MNNKGGAMKEPGLMELVPIAGAQNLWSISR
jgi:hypothetical protein